VPPAIAQRFSAMAHCRDGGRPSWRPLIGVVLPPLWHRGLKGIRDRAPLLLGLAGAFRRSEPVARRTSSASATDFKVVHLLAARSLPMRAFMKAS
jgi:hypothetical protein